MATNKERDAQIDARSERLNNEKPCFSISDKQIFINLHNAATQKAAEKLHKTYSIEMIHDIFINTGMSDDGRSLNDDSKIKSGKNTILKKFGASDKKYEVGLVLQFTEFKTPSNEDVSRNGNDYNKAFLEINKEGLKKLHDTAFDTLHEYFKYFADTEATADKMVEFIPDYNGEKVKIDGYKLVPMDENKRKDYFKNHSGKDAPRLGYKFGYSMVFPGE